MHTGLFILRRILLFITIFFLRRYVGFQLITMMYTNLIIHIFIGLIRPFRDNKKNRLEVLNEFLIVQSTIMYFCFTDWLTDTSDQQYMGYGLLFYVFLLIFVNILVVIYISARQFYLLVYKGLKFLKYRYINTYNLIQNCFKKLHNSKKKCLKKLN